MSKKEPENARVCIYMLLSYPPFFLSLSTKVAEEVKELEEKLEEIVVAAPDQETVVKVESNVPDLPECVEKRVKEKRR